MRLTLKIWRQKNRGARWKVRYVSHGQRQCGHVHVGVPGCAERTADRTRRRSGSVRARLPRRNLRFLRIHDQWSCSWSASRDHGLPAHVCAISRKAKSWCSSLGAPGHFRRSRTWWSTAARSTASLRQGGYISVSTGSAPDGNAILVSKESSDRAMDAAACIGCGACVAACPNASAALFTGAKMTHLGILPQGKPERDMRAIRMVVQMNEEGFGGCTNIGECTGVCPKEIPLEVIAAMNRDYLRASWRERDNLVTTIRPFTEWSTGSKLQNDPHAGT